MLTWRQKQASQENHALRCLKAAEKALDALGPRYWPYVSAARMLYRSVQEKQKRMIEERKEE